MYQNLADDISPTTPGQTLSINGNQAQLQDGPNDPFYDVRTSNCNHYIAVSDK